MRLIAALLLMMPLPASAQQERVSILSALEFPEREGLRVVSFSWHFPGRATVLITGLGVMNGSGSIENYLTDAQTLEFRDPDSNGVLLRKPITITGQAMGSGEEPPPESAFPPTYRSGVITVRAFGSRVTAVAQRHFPRGFTSWQRDGVYHYGTTYYRIAAPEGKRAELAILITQPYAGDRQTFRVRWIFRERGRLSDDWSYEPRTSRKASNEAQALIGVVIAELQREER
jgi:hypothetical protein